MVVRDLAVRDGLEPYTEGPATVLSLEAVKIGGNG